MFLEFLYTLGLTLGVGSSTFALIFYISATADGVVDETEKRFLRIVFRVLRVGMVIFFLSLLARSVAGGFDSVVALAPQWILLALITLNAVLMHYRIMPMRFGPVLAGGSWYSLLFITQFPLMAYGGVVLTVGYALFLTIFYFVFHGIKRVVSVRTTVFRGDVATDTLTRERYAVDASSFKVMPQAVYYPKNVGEIVALVQMCRTHKKQGEDVSLTLRAGGTCMSGGPLNTGWILDMTKHMNSITIDPKGKTATVEMGAYFRDIEARAHEYDLMFAAYPSSRLICGIGGMIGNNASGEKSLRGGATSDNVLELEVVFANGTVERIRPKDIQMATQAREKAIRSLYEQFGAKLQEVTGAVKKSASGYRLEKLISGTTFNEIPLFVGAQGTLGIVTKAVLQLTPIPKHTQLAIISAQSLADVSKIIKTIFAHNPEGLETFDSNTFKKAEAHISAHAQKVIPYIDPEAHLFVLAQFSEDTAEATEKQIAKCVQKLESSGYYVRRIHSTEDVAAAWEVRRNSFLLMRDHNPEGQRAVPCIEDVIVPLPKLGLFIEKLTEILKKRTVHYGFHGHIGDGSLRIIPVFDFTSPTVSDEIVTLMREVFALVKRMKGNISADHSDGIIRTPFLKEFYGAELYGAFEQIKQLYDPENIMNPNKKVHGTIEMISASLDR